MKWFLTYFKGDQNKSQDTSLGVSCANITKKIQREVYQMAKENPFLIQYGTLTT